MQEESSIGRTIIELLAPEARAQGNVTAVTDVVRVLDRLGTWMFLILIGLAVLFIVLAAYKYLFAFGNPAKVQEAHEMIIYALIAAGVGIVARGVVFLVNQLVL